MSKSYTREHPHIRVSAGQSFVIELDANPTTGYQWQPAFDPAALRLDRREFVLAGTALGQGGVERLRFTALAAGATRLSFAYRRAWESAARDEVRFDVAAD